MKVNCFILWLLDPTSSVVAGSSLPSCSFALWCTAWCQLLMSWGATGIQGALVLWVSRCFTEQEMLNSPLKCLQHWGEFHTLSAFPKSGVQLQKSWQLSTLNWLGIRHLFLCKNSQSFKIAYMMNENEMLRKKNQYLTFTCVLVYVSGWLGVSWRIQLLGEQTKEHVFGILAGFLEAPVPFWVLQSWRGEKGKKAER